MPASANTRRPPGFHAVTPSLTVRSAADALDFYSRAFGAVERFRLPDEKTGKLMHAEFMIGDSIMMISDEYPEWGCLAPEINKGASFMIYVDDADAAFARAVEAGCTAVMPPTDQFWGDRCARLYDPFGYRWSVSQHIREMSPEEINQGAAKWSETCQ